MCLRIVVGLTDGYVFLKAIKKKHRSEKENVDKKTKRRKKFSCSIVFEDSKGSLKLIHIKEAL